MEKKPINPEVQRQLRNYFRQLSMLFWIFFAGVLLFLISLVVVAYYRELLNHNLDTFLLIGAPISTAALLLISNRLFADRLKAAIEAEKLHQKMEAYRGASVLRFLLLDGAVFIQLIAYYFTENKLFVLLSLVVLTMFLLYRPSFERFAKELKLSELESEVIHDHIKK